MANLTHRNNSNIEKEPLNSEVLASCLKIIQDSKNAPNEAIAEIAARKCSVPNSSKNTAYWFASWIGVEPELAIRQLASLLEILEQADIKVAESFAMEVIVCVMGERQYKFGTRDRFKLPQHLINLFTLMLAYIKPKEDIDRSNKGVYSPGLRDYAQEARNDLFSLLKSIPGKETYLALMALSENHPLESHRPWMLRHAKERAELDAEPLPWTGDKVREFCRSLESTPANHRELFDLGVQRLTDLKYQLEEGDDSIASTLQKEDRETGIRKVIANWCRDRQVGKYIVTQEEELADAKRPDCRFLSSKFDAPVPMELKLADNWTGSQIFERFENQLCGDYLRDSHSSLGIFVLVYRGDKISWDIPNGKKRATFSELIEALQDYWEKISAKFPKVEDVSVIGIDLTKRSIPSRNI